MAAAGSAAPITPRSALRPSAKPCRRTSRAPMPRCSRRRRRRRQSMSRAGPRGVALMAAATAPLVISPSPAAMTSPRAVGFAAGLDYRLTPDTVAGFALAGGGTDWSLSQGLGGGKSDALQAGVYGATRSGPAYLAAAFAFANHWMSTDRFAVGDHLTANFN